MSKKHLSKLPNEVQNFNVWQGAQKLPAIKIENENEEFILPPAVLKIRTFGAFLSLLG